MTRPETSPLYPPIESVSPENFRVCEEALQYDFSAVFERDEAIRHLLAAHSLFLAARAKRKPTCIEICAGAGGQALGLEMAGFEHVALVEYEPEYCAVLQENRPDWNVICGDVHNFDGRHYRGIDLLAGGVPCPPFSVASKQLGAGDERDLFPEAIRLIDETRPRAVMLENVRGFLDPKFDEYRRHILDAIAALGYRVDIKLLHASDYGVPQLRPRIVIVGIRNDEPGRFSYPSPRKEPPPTVGQTLRGLMGANGWTGLDQWVAGADKIAPTLVGGSKKHGGPDLGPVRARRAWAELGVDGLGVANEAPAPDFHGSPKLTKEMMALIQGFPPKWKFGRRKTAACRMIGNAFPPPVAKAVGLQIRKVLDHA
jgi:DNA (cytosine-5)-methyltransferase 1